MDDAHRGLAEIVYDAMPKDDRNDAIAYLAAFIATISQIGSGSIQMLCVKGSPQLDQSARLEQEDRPDRRIDEVVDRIEHQRDATGRVRVCRTK